MTIDTYWMTAMAVRGRPRTFDREAALRAAMLVFWEKGFTATSMTDLCERMGISSPSLYAAFGSKEALYAEALTYYNEQFSPSLWGPLERAPTARAGMDAFLLASARALTKGPRGCMVTQSMVASEGFASLGDIVISARAALLKKLQSHLTRGVANGELPASTDVKGMARFFLGVQQGMSVQARDGATRRELEAMAAAAMAAWPQADPAGNQHETGAA
jgi:AcrR family transcriptional regulator